MSIFYVDSGSFESLEISSSLVISGSLTINGSDIATFATTASNTFTSTQIISGGLQLNPTQDPDIGNVNLNSAYFFVSSSGDNIEFNLHYRNNGALWETHWLEERADSGLVWGGVLTFTGTTMSITPGAGLIVNHNANTGSHGDTIPTYVQFGPITASAQFITSSQVTYLLIDTDGSLIQQTSIFTPQQYNEKLPLGYIFCLTTSSISSYADARVTTYGQDEQQTQFIRAFGPLKVSGYDITPQSGSLKISIASGRTYRAGGFYTQNPDNPSIYDSSNVLTGSLVRIYRDPAVVGGFKAVTNGGLPFTDIDPTKWDDGSGTLASVGADEWTIQRLFQGVVNNITYVYYGQNKYDSFASAIQSITTEAFSESQTSILALPFIGYIICKGNTTNLGDTTNNKIINSGLFRNTAGSSGGGGVATTNINDLADVNITTPTTGEALVYNAGIWINGVPLNSTNATNAINADSASYVNPLIQNVQITGSLIVSKSLDTSTGLIYDSFGNQRIDWENGRLNAGGEISVDWNAFQLNDSAGILSEDYTARTLYYTDGTTTIIDWYNSVANDRLGAIAIDWSDSGRKLQDSTTAISLDWNNRQLVKSDGATVTLDWENQIITASLFGTASWANNATTASLSLAGSGLFSGSFSGSFQGNFTGDGSALTGVVASTAPGGPDTSIQFNDAGSTSGSANFTFNKTTNKVSVTGSVHATSFSNIVKVSGSSAAAGDYITTQYLTNDVTNSTVNLAVGMTTTNVVAGTYQFKYVVRYQSAATTTGIGLAADHTGTATYWVSSFWFVSTGGTAATGVADQVAAVNAGQMVEGKSERVKGTSTTATAGVDTLNADMLAVMEGVMAVSTDGDLQLEFKSEVAASVVTLKAGTCLILTKLS